MFLVLALLFVKMGLNLLGVIDFLGLSWFRMGGFIELTMKESPSGINKKFDNPEELLVFSNVLIQNIQIHPEGIPQLSTVNCQLSIVNSLYPSFPHEQKRGCPKPEAAAFSIFQQFGIPIPVLYTSGNSA